MKNKKNCIIVSLLVLIVVIGASGGFYIYSIISTGFNIDKTVYVYINQDKNYENLLQQIEDSAKVCNLSHFEQVASHYDYKNNMRTGRYAVKPGMSVRDLVNVLRNGAQTPTRITFNNMRTKKDLCKRLSEQLMFSENRLLSALDNSSKCKELGFDTLTVVAMFIPNTYEFYWDVSVDAFLSRMNKEYKHFWTDERLNKAKEAGLTPIEVSTLAAIVEEECTYSDEYPIVAGLYLNRLHKGMLLQADPTVKFAVGDFSLQRVLNKHLETKSPYNTYQYAGLPPGPIRIPSIKGIDAVLNYKHNDYLYMCAKEDFSGRHNFSKTLTEHNRNADRYRAALNKRKIYK